MSEKLDRVKKHFRDNKKVYIVAGTTAAVSVTATIVIMKYRAATTVEHAELVQHVNQTVIGWGNNPTIVNFIERSTPSKPVHLVGTDRYFASLSEAARETGHSVAKISKNVNGHIPDINGDVFTVLDKVA